MPALTEKKIEKSILDYAMVHLHRDVSLIKLNNVGIWDKTRNTYRKANSPHIKRGIPDIIGCTSMGRMVMIEVKTPKTIIPVRKYYDAVLNMGKFPISITSTIEAQIRLIDEYQKMGALAFFSDGIDHVLEVFEKEGVIQHSNKSFFSMFQENKLAG